MRGTTTRQATVLSTLTSDSLIPLDHPIRRIKPVVEAVLAELAPEFDAMYARTGRQSVPPEQLLKATVLMALYSIRSERQFCERLRYDLLFKFFLDLNVDDEGFDHSTFSRNRERVLPHEIADRFFAAVVQQAHLRRYISARTSVWTAPCLRRGPRTRASGPRTGARATRRRRDGTRRWITTASGAATRPTNPPPTPRRALPAKDMGLPRSSATPATSSWRTGAR
jgi:transposase